MLLHKLFPNITKSFKQGLLDLILIWQMETRIIFHDEGVLIFSICVPLGYPLIYSYFYNNEVVKEVPITVVDQSHTSLSREYIRKLDATSDVKVMATAADIPEARQSIREQQTYGYVVIPSEFQDDLNKGKQAHVGLFCDMSGLLYYRAILLSNAAVSGDISKNIRIERSGNTTQRQDELSDKPVDYEEEGLYNPTMGFASFLIPAVLMLIIQQTLLLAIGMASGTAYENNEYAKLIPTNRHNRGTYHILIGIALSYFLVYMVNAAYMTCIVPMIFHLTILSHPYDLFMFMVPYILACIFFAMSLAVLVRNRELSILIFVFTSVPLLFISGVSWPGAAIPQFWKSMSFVFPSTFGINGFMRINTMGAHLEDVSFEYRMLWLQAGIYFLTSFLSSRIIIYRSRRRQHVELDQPFM